MGIAMKNRISKKFFLKYHYAWWILAGCCAFMMAVMGIVNSCQGLFLLSVTKALDMTRSQFSMGITLQGLIGVVSMPIAGRILPRCKIRVILGCAFILYIGSFTAFSLISSLSQFLVLSGILGLSGGFLTYIPVAVLISNWFQEKQGFAMGLAVSFTGIGGAVFNPVGSLLIQSYGWRFSYQILGLIGLVIALPAIMIFQYTPEDKGLRPYGFSGKENPPETDNCSSGSAFRSIHFHFILLWSIFIGILGGVMYHIPAFVNQLNYSPAFGGFIMSLFMVSMTAGKIILGYLDDRLGSIVATAIFCLFSLIGIVCFLLAGNGMIFLIIGAALFGPGMALMLVETPILVKKIFGNVSYSAIYSIISMVVNVMATMSVFVFGAVYDIYRSYAPSFKVLLLCPVIAFIGAATALKQANSVSYEK